MEAKTESIPLKWAVGDLCRAFGRVARIERKDVMLVRFRDGTTILADRCDLDMVFGSADAPADDAGR